MRNILLTAVAAASLVTMSGPLSAAETAQQLRTRVNMLAPDMMHGAQLFERCAACHASDGGGVEDGSVPDIAGQYRSVLVKQVIDYRFARRWDPRMEVIAAEHSLSRPQDIADVTAFIAAMPFRSGAGHGDGNDVAHGQQVYGELCAGCHGREGGGDAAKAVPRLAGQHYEYLRRQLYDAVDRRRPNFSADHVRLLKRFERADFAGVADYLSRLEDAPAAGR
jgi:cytochrome c553